MRARSSEPLSDPIRAGRAPPLGSTRAPPARRGEIRRARMDSSTLPGPISTLRIVPSSSWRQPVTRVPTRHHRRADKTSSPRDLHSAPPTSGRDPSTFAHDRCVRWPLHVQLHRRGRSVKRRLELTDLRHWPWQQRPEGLGNAPRSRREAAAQAETAARPAANLAGGCVCGITALRMMDW